MNHLHLIRRATNLNDNKSLIIHPWSTIYAEFTEEERMAMKIRKTAIRLSVGIEGAADLIEDIESALQSLHKSDWHCQIYSDAAVSPCLMSGMVNTKRDPAPLVDETWILPPSISTYAFEMERPRPAPS